MPRTRYVMCTPTKRKHIDVLCRQGLSYRTISAELGLPLSTVAYNAHKVADLSSFYADRPRSGRPAKITPRKLRRACREITSGRARNATQVQRTLFPFVEPRTMRLHLSAAGLKGYVRRKVPYLRPHHIRARLAFAEQRLEWAQSEWDRIVFSDESKFNLFASDGRQYCRRRPGEAYLPRCVRQEVKHGGGHVMVWGCITAAGTGRLYRIEGNLNAVGLCAIYDEALLGTLEDWQLTPETVIFQQDNDSKHKSKLAARWLGDHHINLLEWPSSSPDLNPIENAWDQLDKAVRARNPLPRNAEEMWAALQEEWAKLDFSYIRALYTSMPRRVAAVVEAKGCHTKY